MELNLSALEFFFLFFFIILSLSLLPFLFSPLLNLSLSPFPLPKLFASIYIGGGKKKYTGRKKKIKKIKTTLHWFYSAGEKRGFGFLVALPGRAERKRREGGRGRGWLLQPGPSLCPRPCPHRPVPVPVPIPGTRCWLHPRRRPRPLCPHAVTVLSPPRCRRPEPLVTRHEAMGWKKSASVAAGPKTTQTAPRMDLGHRQRGETEARGRARRSRRCRRVPKTGSGGVGGHAARGCHPARAAGGCRGWRGTRRSGDVIDPGTSPSSRPICRGAEAILGSGNLGLSAKAGRVSGQGRGWLVEVVASRTEPRACPQPRVAARAPNPPGDRGEQGWDLGRGSGQRGPRSWGCPQPAPAASPCPRATRAGDGSRTGTRVPAQPGGTLARSSQPAN